MKSNEDYEEVLGVLEQYGVKHIGEGFKKLKDKYNAMLYDSTVMFNKENLVTENA